MARVYILTSQLVALRGAALPLPWYHRAPLGLMSGTAVHVALQAPRTRPFGDLLVSLVDPAHWPFASEISASKPDEPGVLADVYTFAPPLNIVFAEAVTVDSGSRHEARLVLEPYRPSSDEAEVGPMVQEQIERLTSSLIDMGFEDPSSTPLYPESDKLPWMGVGRIDLGWVHVKNWREAVLKQASTAASADNYDLNMAVVSADTDRRLLRYVFPRKGAVSVSVEHADQPGAMGMIARALADSNLNILSSLLRRGSVPPTQAQLVVVVEPNDESTDAGEVERRARDALSDLPSTLRVDVQVSGPENAVLYPRRPHEIAVRPSPALESTILAVRDALPSDKRPIFISRRFADTKSQYNLQVVKELREVLDECGFVAVEALPQPGGDRAVSEGVKAKMWASQAAIMLVVSTPDQPEFSEFSVNLAHECGFMQGQGKQLLPLVQADLLQSITRNANLQGLQLTTFDKEAALNRQSPDSIYATVRAWLRMLVDDIV